EPEDHAARHAEGEIVDGLEPAEGLRDVPNLDRCFHSPHVATKSSIPGLGTKGYQERLKVLRITLLGCFGRKANRRERWKWREGWQWRRGRAMAEREGFEPSKPFRAYRFSRPA